jgi:hypothetical protein
MNIYFKDHADKLYNMLQQSATISRCRVHIWYGCTTFFVKISAFDQNVGNANRCTTVPTRRRLLSMWLMSTSRECQVRNRVTFISSLVMDLRVECTWRGKFHTSNLLPCVCGPCILDRKQKHDEREHLFKQLGQGTVSHVEQRSWSMHRQPWWGGTPSAESRKRDGHACIHGDYKALRNQ